MNSRKFLIFIEMHSVDKTILLTFPGNKFSNNEGPKITEVHK